MTKEIIAVDVSKSKLDIYCDNDGSAKSIENSEKAIKTWIQELKSRANILVVFEATARYESLLLELLLDNKIECVKCSGKRVRDFAKSQGKVKTDKLDAKMIANYAKSSKLKLCKGFDQDLLKLKELNTRRRQLLDLINQESNRLEHHFKTDIKTSIDSVLACLKNELCNLETAIDNLILDSTSINNKVDILVSIPGIRRVCAVTLLAELPELGLLDKAEIANLGGLAPQNYDSGKYKGHRFVNRSRAEVKKVLYMSAMNARSNNSKIKVFFEKLKKKR